ncbi:unnamed protein product [Calicophoron daubneyi]|uniref:EF-hand domain-containing protein n=1 Tax=Calicophoron daubneyi TaxID=300641 RepID=A0AAV2T909_CALDB
MAQTQLHDVEKMIDLFMEIDTSNDECVDKKELMEHYRKANVPESAIDDWMKKFDTDKDGKVSLTEFCRGLGIKVDELRVEQKQRAQARAGKGPELDKDVEIVATTMSQEKQSDITRKFKELVTKNDGKEESMKEVANQMKNYLDGNYGRVWQCVILTGSYWMHFSHEPFLSIQFRYGRYICLAWRTPRG